jgi:cysteine-rich repeat protein
MIQRVREAVLALGVLGLIALSCGKSPAPGTCTAGQTQACTCPGGASGTQTCLADLSGFGTCQCGQQQNDSGQTPDGGNTGNDSGTPNDAGGGTQDSGPAGDAGPNLCGNGVVDPGEDCDDGNRLNLDGCDSTCHYEVITRMTSLNIGTTAAPSFCMPNTNQFGAHALTSAAVLAIGVPLSQDITNGKLNVMTPIYGLTDLTGVNDPNAFTVGVVSGKYQPGLTFSSSVDGRFFADPTNLTNGRSTNVLSQGHIASQALTAGPSSFSLALPLGGVSAVLEMTNAAIAGLVDVTAPPTTPGPPPNPNQLAAGLKVFQTVTASGATQGLCGNITVESLAQIPVPQILTALPDAGQFACACGGLTYTYCGAGNPVGPNCNSLLDVLVGGCNAKVGICTQVVNATEPDVAANGTVTHLTLTPGTNKVAQTTAGDKDAYSAWLKFDAERVHITGQFCGVATDCQTGQICDAGQCQ